MSGQDGDGDRAQPVDQPEVELVSAVVHATDGTRECTIYPKDAPNATVTTTWLTAREGSFVSLRRAR